jgi:hypothetical protein
MALYLFALGGLVGGTVGLLVLALVGPDVGRGHQQKGGPS